MSAINAAGNAGGGSLSFYNSSKRRETPEKKKDGVAKKIIDTQKETRRSIERSGLGQHIDLQA